MAASAQQVRARRLRQLGWGSVIVTRDGRVGYRVTDRVTVALATQQFNQSLIVETAGPPVE